MSSSIVILHIPCLFFLSLIYLCIVQDGDTALLKAVRNRNTELVELLIGKGGKVSATDKKGDSVLHIALRARSKKLTEILLRNPKDSRLLYRPNKAGETPYNIDVAHQKSILTQIFGASEYTVISRIFGPP